MRINRSKIIRRAIVLWPIGATCKRPQPELGRLFEWCRKYVPRETIVTWLSDAIRMGMRADAPSEVMSEIYCEARGAGFGDEWTFALRRLKKKAACRN